MYSVTIAYANSDQSSQRQNEWRYTRPYYYLKKLIQKLDNSVLPQFHGHGYSILRSPEAVHVYSFGPKRTASKTPIKETRINACTLNSGYANVPRVLKILARSKLIPPLRNHYEGDVQNAILIYPPSYVQACVTASITETEFKNALGYVQATEKNPPTVSLLHSNCLAYAIEVANQGGFDMFRYAEGRNALMPDGYLSTFLNITRGLNPVEDNRWEGNKDGRLICVVFNDRNLLAIARDLLKTDPKPPALVQSTTQTRRPSGNHL